MRSLCTKSQFVLSSVSVIDLIYLAIKFKFILCSCVKSRVLSRVNICELHVSPGLCKKKKKKKTGVFLCFKNKNHYNHLLVFCGWRPQLESPAICHSVYLKLAFPRARWSPHGDQTRLRCSTCLICFPLREGRVFVRSNGSAQTEALIVLS